MRVRLSSAESRCARNGKCSLSFIVNLTGPVCTTPKARAAAFTLVEVMVAVAVLGIMLASLYSGFFFGFEQVRLAREEARASQILEERMEVVRLLNWDQVVNLPGFIPSTFTAPFYAANPTNPPPDSFIYSGTVLVTNAPVTETYSNDLRMIRIEVTWPSGRVIRKTQMTTFVCQYGLQKYTY